MDGSSGQAAFGLVAAAFCTGLWAWLSQKAKSKIETGIQEVNADVQDRQNLLQEYRQSNKQLQEHVVMLNTQMSSLWSVIGNLRDSLEECEKARLKGVRKIVELERSMNRC